jgi:phospholipid transport system transporter-binding protein
MNGARHPSSAAAPPPAAPATATLSRVGPGRWRLDGVLNLATVVPLSSQCPEADARGCSELDLGGIQRSSSAGVALLLEWQSRLHAAGGRLHLTEVPEGLLRLAALGNAAEILGLDQPATITDAAPEPTPTAGS